MTPDAPRYSPYRRMSHGLRSAGFRAAGGKAGDDAIATCDIEHPLSGTGSRAVDQIGGPE